MTLTGKNLIGKSESSQGDQIFNAINPANGEQLPGNFFCATEEEINQAFALAGEAFVTYKNVSGAKRAEFLEAIGEEIVALGDVLVDRAVAETGLPPARIQGERGRTVGQLKMFANLIREGSWVEASIDTAIPDREPIPKPDVRKMLVPIGPVVVFGASNFPLAFSTAGGDTASALAAGNPVIVKSHEGHLGTGELVARAIIKAAERTGMPNGVFSILNGDGPTVGQALVKHPACKAIGFTGSPGAGRALFNAAASREEPIPVYAEMGSVNPVILLPGALEKKAAELGKIYAGSVTLGVGQFCTNPGLMIGVEGDSLNEYLTSLSSAIREMEPATMLNEKVWQGYNRAREHSLAQDGVEEQAISETGVNGDNWKGRPTVASVTAQRFLENPTLHEEVFGPYTLMIKCTSNSDLAAVVDELQGQLTATVMGEEEDLITYADVINGLKEKTGRIIFNGVPTGVEVCASMHHGGPYPSTTDAKYTSVGTAAIKRFARPLCYQSWPDSVLPDELKNANPLNIWRLQDNNWTNGKI
ncbi:aldehyde dehydrogenase (NADP(+)) [Fulvivirgaceae bacterium BMA10]|uniref:Aldehyde dehydrogenase (NADP(+)) n=1 Tax=Splendidivirga corallicola TaxID=3051826 RepID=A0ABT8KH99_9BACT|nr:aldehyde dehydrogenase (NADP(+)) [Fulvivirgaceae bacterium BMA10]